MSANALPTHSPTAVYEASARNAFCASRTPSRVTAVPWRERWRPSAAAPPHLAHDRRVGGELARRAQDDRARDGRYEDGCIACTAASGPASTTPPPRGKRAARRAPRRRRRPPPRCWQRRKERLPPRRNRVGGEGVPGAAGAVGAAGAGRRRARRAACLRRQRPTSPKVKQSIAVAKSAVWAAAASRRAPQRSPPRRCACPSRRPSQIEGQEAEQSACDGGRRRRHRRQRGRRRGRRRGRGGVRVGAQPCLDREAAEQAAPHGQQTGSAELGEGGRPRRRQAEPGNNTRSPERLAAAASATAHG